MYDECTEELRRTYTPSDVEFRYCQELVLSRPVTLLKEVPPCVLNLRGLRCLEFTGHPITSVPAEISRLVSLKRLVLVALFLEELPDEIGELHNLEQLLVPSCAITRLPSTISKLAKLWDLYVDSNQLTRLPSVLPPRIDEMKVSGNLLTELPGSHANCEGMRAVRAYANKLTSLPSALCSARSLVELSIQGNFLTTLPAQIDRLQSLRFLSVHDNLLEALPDSLADITELRWVTAYNNRLTTLPPHILTRPSRLERLLVEANPLTEKTVVDLLSDVPRHVRAVGVDAAQVSVYERAEKAASAGMLGLPAPLPSSVMSGWTLPWGRVYAKLVPSAQLRREPGVRPVSCDLAQRQSRSDVLLVAFAASQAEPEWFGILGLIASQHVAPASARKRILRRPVPSFSHLHQEMHGSPLNSEATGDIGVSARLAMATAWCAPRPTTDEGAVSAEAVPVFDTLFLCDTNAQWYLDIDCHTLGLRAKLQDITSKYRRVMFLGVSMGGFGALLYSDLAHTVAVFGPQTDLRRSHLRPGLPRGELEAATRNMRASVREALARGTRFEYHVAMEDHLIYARQLQLPSTSLVVHPIAGRIARVLDKAGLLLPMIIDLIVELHADYDGGVRPWEDSVVFQASLHAAAQRQLQQQQQAPKQPGCTAPLPDPQLFPSCSSEETSHEQAIQGHSRPINHSSADGGCSIEDSTISASTCARNMLETEDRDVPMAFCWRGTNEGILLGLWGTAAGCNYDSSLSFCWVSGQELSALCQNVPQFGSWFCSSCHSCSPERTSTCVTCGADSTDCLVVVGSSNQGRKFEQPPTPCRLHPQRHQLEQAAGGSSHTPGVQASTGQPLVAVASRDRQTHGDLRDELSSAWFIVSSTAQRWTWRSEGDCDCDLQGSIEFCQDGMLRTTWGLGVWARMSSGDLHTVFGSPPCTWCLHRTSRGFLAMSSCGSAPRQRVGWPVHGKVPMIGREMVLHRVARFTWSPLLSALRRFTSRQARLSVILFAVGAMSLLFQRRLRRVFLHQLSSPALLRPPGVLQRTSAASVHIRRKC